MTTSRELVYRALRFEHPDRVPRDLWWQVWTEDHFPAELADILERFPSDFLHNPLEVSLYWPIFR